MFSLRDVPDELKAVATLLALDTVWRQVSDPAARRRSLVVVDEAWLLMRNLEGARFLTLTAGTCLPPGQHPLRAATGQPGPHADTVGPVPPAGRRGLAGTTARESQLSCSCRRPGGFEGFALVRRRPLWRGVQDTAQQAD